MIAGFKVHVAPSSRCFIRKEKGLQNSRKKWKLWQFQHRASSSFECYVLNDTLIHPAADSRLPKTRQGHVTNSLLCTTAHTIILVTYLTKTSSYFSELQKFVEF